MRRLGNRRHTTPRPGRAVPVTVTKFYNLAALAPAANPIMIVRVESRSDSPATAAAAQSGLPDFSVLAGNGSFDRRLARPAAVGPVGPGDAIGLAAGSRAVSSSTVSQPSRSSPSLRQDSLRPVSRGPLRWDCTFSKQVSQTDAPGRGPDWARKSSSESRLGSEKKNMFGVRFSDYWQFIARCCLVKPRRLRRRAKQPTRTGDRRKEYVWGPIF